MAWKEQRKLEDMKRPCHQEQRTSHQWPVWDNLWGLSEPMTSWRMPVLTDDVEDHAPLSFLPDILKWHQDLEITQGERGEHWIGWDGVSVPLSLITRILFYSMGFMHLKCFIATVVFYSNSYSHESAHFLYPRQHWILRHFGILLLI